MPGAAEVEVETEHVWGVEDDDALKTLVEKWGTKKWSMIADKMSKEYNLHARTGKQCRERWSNHLGNLVISD